jgi:hypothetical protein
MRMVATRIALFLFLVPAALPVACGQLTPLEDEQACPCAPGYTCCNGACLAGAACGVCSGSIALGTESVPDVPDAQTVTGKVDGTLDRGTRVPFSYATSIWPTPYGWLLNGWLVTASAGEPLAFQLWAAEEDAGVQPLSLVLYGPLEGLDTAACTGTSVGNGPLVGPEIRWTAPADGTFFAAPFHDVVQTPAGLAFEGLNDSNYAHAFIVMNPAE